MMELYRGLRASGGPLCGRDCRWRNQRDARAGGHFRQRRRFGGKKIAAFSAHRRQSRRRPLRHRQTGRIERRPTPEFRSADRGSALADATFPHSCDDGFERWTWGRSSASGEGERSRFSRSIKSALPRDRGCSIEQAINDGEDYELLFAVSPNDAAALEKKWRKKFPRLPLTRIGAFERRTQNPNPQFLPWLRSFPIAWRKRSPSRASGRRSLAPNDVVALSRRSRRGQNAFRQRPARRARRHRRSDQPDFHADARISRRAAAGFSFRFLSAQSPRRSRRSDSTITPEEGGIAVIEWADRFPEVLPERTRWLRLEAPRDAAAQITRGRAMKVLALELSSPVGSVASLRR